MRCDCIEYDLSESYSIQSSLASATFIGANVMSNIRLPGILSLTIFLWLDSYASHKKSVLLPQKKHKLQ